MPLPCWDETDDGIPPPCTGNPSWWKIFNKKNKLLNHSLLGYKFGNVGFPHMDIKRKTWMGLAMWCTLLTMVVTAFGCFALSTSESVVRTTYWARLRLVNEADDSSMEAFIGLRSMLVVTQSGATMTSETVLFNDDETYGGFPNGLIGEQVENCDGSARNYAIGAFITSFTLIFGLQGTIARMKFSADAPIQKVLGCLADSFGVFSLLATLLDFFFSCYSDMPSEDGKWVVAQKALGPGWFSFLFCALTGALRAIIHWLTPVPGFGADGHHGCHCGQWPLPKALLDDLKDEEDHEAILEAAHQLAHRPEVRSVAARFGDGGVGYGSVAGAEEMIRN